MPVIHEFAPAKLNLYLHITGRRADGYHDLDSLVAFASVGDDVRLEPATSFAFRIEGPQAIHLGDQPPETNLVVKAAHSLAALTGNKLDVRLTLVKNLPVASGIGGGSSDAAAALRALARHWGLAANDPRLVEAAIQHGQDVPVCLTIENNYITATGTLPAHALPSVAVVLVNPNQALPTPAVYKAYKEKGYGFSPQAQFTVAPKDVAELVMFLKERGNDLYQPARDLMPEIADILDELEGSDSLLARMSGSGATCFALYATPESAQKAAEYIQARHKNWWVATSFIPYLGNR